MKIGSFLLILLLSSKVCFSDTLDLKKFDYSRADSIALSLTKSFRSADILALALTNGLETEHEKFRSIFIWVTNNISYNIANGYQNSKYTLRKMSAQCAGYSKLILELCSISNIECKMINGYCKSDANDIRKFKKINHTWNVVKLNGSWYISDATWATGTGNGRGFEKKYNDFYFLADPDKIKLNHFPEDTKWFLTEDYPSLKKYGKLPVFYSSFFQFGINPVSQLNGIVKNHLEFIIQSDEEILRASFKFEKSKEFETIPIKKDNDGNYLIDIELDDSFHGPLVIYLNGKGTMVFKKK